MATYDFTGVTPGAHLAALRRFYAVVNPEKVDQVGLMLDKFGTGIWAAMQAKYSAAGVENYVPKPLVESSFGDASEAEHVACLQRFYAEVCPEKLATAGPAWNKFRANVWAALSDKYPNVDLNAYAPVKAGAAPARAPAPAVSPTNPFAPRAAAPAPVPAPAPAAPNTDDFHKARLREFFAEHRPENVPKVDEFYAKLGKHIWAAMEAKYPGKTARYTADLDLPTPSAPGAPTAAVPPPAPAPESNPFIRFNSPAPAPARAPAPVPIVAPAPVPAPITAPPAPAAVSRNPFSGQATPPSLSRSNSGTVRVTAADLEPAAFTGVPEAAHLAGLRNFYSAVNPEKVGQVDLVWQKFGIGVWKSLYLKYPDIEFGKFAPVKARQSFASSNAFALSEADSPRRATPNIFGADTPKESPLSRTSSTADAAPPVSLLPVATEAKPSVNVATLFSDDGAYKPAVAAAPRPVAAVDDLFRSDLVGNAGGVAKRNALFTAGGGGGEETPVSEGGQGSFAAALLEEDGGIREVVPQSTLGGLFSVESETPKASPGPTYGEISSVLEETQQYATYDYNALFAEQAAPAPAPAPAHAPVKSSPLASSATSSSTGLVFSDAGSVDEAGGLFSDVRLEDTASFAASSDLFGMVAAPVKDANAPSSAPGVGDIASYVASSQATSGEGADATLFQ